MEIGERRVYLEYPPARQFPFEYFASLATVFCTTLCLALILAISHIILNPLLTLAVTLVPSISGLLVGVICSARSGRVEKHYGVRGVPRRDLSTTITFLDMVASGLPDIGKIPEFEKPEEFSSTSFETLRITRRVLDKIDPGLGTRWHETLSEGLSQAISPMSKAFIRVTLFGAVILVVFAKVLDILGVLTPVDSLLVPVLIVAFILAALAAHAVKRLNTNPPLELQEALHNPKIRNETTYVLDHLLTVIIEEGEYPLRLLVLSDYNELQYTGRTYLTTTEVSLRETVLIPRFVRL